MTSAPTASALAASHPVPMPVVAASETVGSIGRRMAIQRRGRRSSTDDDRSMRGTTSIVSRSMSGW